MGAVCEHAGCMNGHGDEGEITVLGAKCVPLSLARALPPLSVLQLTACYYSWRNRICSHNLSCRDRSLNVAMDVVRHVILRRHIVTRKSLQGRLMLMPYILADIYSS